MLKNDCIYPNKHFFILGCSRSGTSLLCGLMNAHSKCEVDFEVWADGRGRKDIVRFNFDFWDKKRDESQKKDMLYGNKIPLEQFSAKQWNEKDFIKFFDHGYFVLFISRRFSKYCNMPTREIQYKEWWAKGQKIYWNMREYAPDKIIQISYEDLVLRPQIELIRISNFLDIEYEPAMLTGCQNTGYLKYNQSTIHTNSL